MMHVKPRPPKLVHGQDEDEVYAYPEWRDHAKCKGQLDLFVPNDGESLATVRAKGKKAKAICRTCPVKEECLEHVLQADTTTTRPLVGTWAETSGRERYRIRKAREANG